MMCVSFLNISSYLEVGRMAGLFDKQAEVYLEARPTYPKEWYMKLAALTPQHSLAWDVGTGNGQAAYSVRLSSDQL